MYIKATAELPEVDLRFTDESGQWTGKGWIRGRVKYGAVAELFRKISEHLTNEFLNPQGTSYEIDIKLIDYDSSVHGPLTSLLELIGKFQKEGIKVRVIWLFDPRRQPQERDANFLLEKFGSWLMVEPTENRDD